MRFFYRILPFFRALFESGRIDAEINEELHFHIDREAQQNIARGMSPAKALLEARRTVGRTDAVRETAGDERPGQFIRQTLRDVRFGARLLARSPAFGIAAVTIVALGVGAASAIFSVVYGVMLSPLPFREPDRLVTIWSSRTATGATHLFPTAADALAWRQDNAVFEDIALVRTVANLNLVGDGEPERLQGARISPNLLRVLGVSPAMGRAFRNEEAQDGNDHVVILSDALWRRRFGADAGIVGRQIQLNGTPYAVVGVMGPEFQYPSREFLAWVPVVFDPRELTRQVTQNYRVIARLRPGVTLDRARLELTSLSARLESAFPATNRGLGVAVESMQRDAVRDVRAPMIALMGAVACLLLIAGLNLSNLLGARAAARNSEFALRIALGASRGRLVAQALAEVAPTLLAGGAIGLLVALMTVRIFAATAPPGVPRVENVSLSGPVLLASLGILVVIGAVTSVMPMLQALRSDFTTLAKDRSRSATAGRRNVSSRRVGVALQIAFAVPLLAGAGLLLRSSLNVARVEFGFQPQGVATFHLAVPRSKYPSDADVAEFYARLLDTVRGVSGVTHAGMINRLPLAGAQTMSVVAERAGGDTVPLGAVDSRPITPDLLAALGIALQSGRPFDEHDDARGVPVSIVDAELAARIWPGENAVGKRMRRFDGVWTAVVGVVKRVHNDALDVEARPQVYWPYRQVTQDRMVLVVRTNGDARALVAPVTSAIRALDADQPVYDVRTMDAVVNRSLAQRRLVLALIITFGVIAAVLAAVGVYGVVAYGVTQRLREFGIRVALGASRADVTRLVVVQGLLPAAAGAAAGLLAAVLLAGFMRTLVFGVAPRDAVSLAAATGALLLVAAAASYIPARRAARVDPAVTLRSE